MMPNRSRGVLSLVLSLALAAPAVAEKPSTDRNGDPLPEGAVARLGSVRFLHADWVHSLAFAPDGKSLVSGTQEAFLRLWDAATGREVRRFSGDGSSVTNVAPSPDGKLLAASDNGQSFIVWEAATGKRAHVLPRNSAQGAVAWSPDGKVLAFGGADLSIRLWDVGAWKELRRLKGHTGVLGSLVFSPDGKLLVSAAHDKTFRVWDPATGKELRRLDGQPEATGSLAFSADGRSVAGDCMIPFGGGYESTFRLWDATTGKIIRQLPAWSVHCTAFSPDGKLLANGDGNRLIHLWDPKTGKELRRWEAHEERVTAVAFSPDGKALASGGADRRIRLWDPATGEEIRPAEGHRGAVQTVAFAPDGKTVASGGLDRTLRFWDWVSGRQRRCCEGVGSYWGAGGLAYSPDGKRLASLEIVTDGGVFRLWSSATGEMLSRFGGKGLHASAIAFLPDNETLAVALWDGQVGVWEPTAGKLLRRVGKHNGRLLALAPSPDGKVLAWAGEYGKLGTWDAATGAERLRLQGAGHFCADVAFSPDGAVLATTGDNNPVCLWDARTGAKLAQLPNDRLGLRGLAFSPDGALLASGSAHGVVLWDVRVRKELCYFTGHLAEVKAVAFAPDGRVIVSASADGTLLVWDLTGRLKDGRLPPLALAPAELEERWGLLAAQPEEAQRAAWALAACPQAVAFLQKKVRPVRPADADRLKRLIADLDADGFAVREKATRELEELGEAAAPALREALAAGPSVEVRMRVERLLRRFQDPTPSGETLRSLWSVTALERRGGTEARRVLQTLAAGAPQAGLTREAKAALARLDRRTAAAPP